MRGISGITGNTNPQIGQDAFYEVASLYPGTVIGDYNQVKWKLFRKSNGSWVELRGTLKTGRKVSFNFPQKWYGHELMIEAFISSPERKSPPGLIVRPVMGPKNIKTVEIRDANGNAITQPPKYGQSVTAKITTENMMGETLKLSLWDRDTFSSTGHDPSTNTKLWEGNAKVTDASGVVSHRIMLTPAMMIAANRSLFEGGEHEYYLLAQADNTRAKFSPETTQVSSEIVLSPRVAPASPAPRSAPAQPRRPVEAQAPVNVQNNNSRDEVPPTGNTAATVDDNEIETSENKCPNCEKDITLAQIEHMFGVITKHKAFRQEVIDHINDYVKKSKDTDKPIHLDTCLRKAHFFAQVGAETLGINPDWMVETDAMKYSVANCKSVFGQRARNLEAANLLAAYCADRPQTRLLNYLYAAENGFGNGNGNEASGDGYLFRGRGLKQLTGRGNYKQASEIFQEIFPEEYIDLEADPDKVAEPKYAVITALAYWEKHSIWRTADTLTTSTDDNIKIIRRKVNPGLAGWRAAKGYFEKGLEAAAFNLDACEKDDVEGGSSTGVTIRLVRKWETEISTIGEFTIDDSDITGYILEEKGPDTTVSGQEQRVPVGTYNLVWHSGTRFKNVLKLYNDSVSQARAILIHAGNYATDTEGCLLPGSTKTTDFVGSSKAKLKEINDHVTEKGIENAQIIITAAYE